MRKVLIPLFLIACFVGCQVKQPEFVSIESPAGEQSSLSRLVTDSQGSVHMTWVEKMNDTTALYYSVFDGNGWAAKRKLAESENWFVNWADFPNIAVSNQQLQAVNTLPKSSEGTYSYDVQLTTFDGDDSKSFLAHNDGTPTEHGFVSMQSTSDTTFYAIWLDGRNTTGHHEPEHGHESGSDLSSAMTLRGGEFHINGSQLTDDLIDESVCDCCNTSLIQSPEGLIAAYRNRTEEEIRDIYVARRIDGKWSKGESVSDDQWKMKACPVNGAQLASYENEVTIAWFTAADEKNVIKVAFSDKDNQSFGEAITLDFDKPLGRVDVEMTESGSAWVGWMTGADENGLSQFKISHITNAGEVLFNASVADMKASRRSGFPQMTKSNNGLILSWTQLNDDGSSKVIVESLTL